MKGRILAEKQIVAFATYLENEEKSNNTIEKYIRDVQAFAKYVNGAEVTKEIGIAYKNNLLSENYAVRSINSMLASVNSLFMYLGWEDLKVKSIKLQRQIYCPEEKELTKAEYVRLVNTAKQKGNERSFATSDDMRHRNTSERTAIYYSRGCKARGDHCLT